MKTVGIITYHKHYNYGTMLQAFALQEAIRKMGCRTEIIDFFQPNKLSGKEKFFYYCRKGILCIRNPKEVEAIILKKKTIEAHSLDINEREKAFDDFYNEHISLSNKKYNNDSEIMDNPPEYDVYIVGSDQTWNPNVGGNPEAFYLSFASPDKRRVSYGPSISAESLTKKQSKRMSRLLENVELLSCREEQGARLLRKITGREVVVVLDPVFLLSQDEWKNYGSRTQYPSKYILQYFLGNNIQHRKYVQVLAQEKGLPIIALPHDSVDFDNKDVTNIWCGPDEFLSLVRNATLVCTDSFHGTAFSLIFEKEVYSFLKHKQGSRKSENSRIENLYKTFGIDNRIITNCRLNFDKELPIIDYDKVREKIRIKKDESLEYLRDAIQITE